MPELPKGKTNYYPGPKAYEKLEANPAQFHSISGQLDSEFVSMIIGIKDDETLTEDERNGVAAFARDISEKIRNHTAGLSDRLSKMKNEIDACMSDARLSETGRIEEKNRILSEGVKDINDTQLLGNLKGELARLWGNIRPTEFEPADASVGYLQEREIREHLSGMMASDRVLLYLQQCQNPTDDSLAFFAAVERQVPGLPPLIEQQTVKQGRKTRALKQNPARALQADIAEQATAAYFLSVERALGALEKGGFENTQTIRNELSESKTKAAEFKNVEV